MAENAHERGERSAAVDRALERFSPHWSRLTELEASIAREFTEGVEIVGGRDAAAELLGIGRSSVDNYRSGKRKPSAPVLAALRAAVSQTAARFEFMKGMLEERAQGAAFESDFSAAMARLRPSQRSEVEPADLGPLAPSGKPLPLRGTAAGSVTGSIAISGDAVDWLFRPPGLADSPDAYALTVRGRSMEPRLMQGDLIFVDPGRPFRPGDLVVVQTQDHSTADYLAYVKEFVREAGSSIFLRQLNPEAGVEFRLVAVRYIHRVLTTRELFGL